jgi:hypothetical protein
VPIRRKNMKSFVTILALGLGLAFTVPAFAGGGAPPTTKADCEKAGMKWNDSSGKCEGSK